VSASLLLAAVLLLSPADRPPEGTLVVGTLTDPVSLEPHLATDILGAEIVSNVCETLVRIRPDSLRPEGVLATTWATVDQRSWTFTLREGVFFHDGTPFDADAVVGNFEHLARERSFSGRAVRIGPYVVQLTLDRPNAALLSTLSQPFFSIQSPRQLEGSGSDRPVGTGPFGLVRVRPGRVELEAFREHWGSPPHLARLVFQRFPDEPSLVRALIDGRIDVTSAVYQSRVAELRDRPEIVLDSQSGMNLAYLALNNEHPPFDDPRVRQAVARALDRPRIVDVVLEGYGQPAAVPLPPSLFPTDRRARRLVHDREIATRLLARAGLPEGFETVLTVSAAPRPYLPEPLHLADLLREQLAGIGVHVSLQTTPDWADHVERTSRGAFDMAVLGWQADTLDPNDFLTVLLDSQSIGTTNRSRYRSDEMDRLLKRARMESGRQARAALYRRAESLFQEEMPFVPLYHASVFTARRQEVIGLVATPIGIVDYENVSKRK
jgi:peptide/nickel transport system substrate-binding protein